MSAITPFDPTIPQDEVDRLFRKLADTRLPEIPVVPDAGDDYGISLPPSRMSQLPLTDVHQAPHYHGSTSSTTT